MKNTATLLALMFIASLCLVLPHDVLAQEGGGLVPCNGPNCDTISVVTMANNVISYLIRLLVVLGTIALVISGFKLVTSRGNVAAKESAQNMFTNVVLGLILVLAAWLIVDTIMKGLTGSGLAGWTLFS